MRLMYHPKLKLTMMIIHFREELMILCHLSISNRNHVNDMVLTDISNTVSSTCSQKCEKKDCAQKSV